MVRYSFPVRLFHSLLHAGLSRRTDVPDFGQVAPYGKHGTGTVDRQTEEAEKEAIKIQKVK
jgi:hypothetical protein